MSLHGKGLGLDERDGSCFKPACFCFHLDCAQSHVSMPGMNSKLNELRTLAAIAENRRTKTGIPRVAMVKGKIPEHMLAAVYDPMINLILRGSKTMKVATVRCGTTRPLISSCPSSYQPWALSTLPSPASHTWRSALRSIPWCLRHCWRTCSNLPGDTITIQAFRSPLPHPS